MRQRSDLDSKAVRPVFLVIGMTLISTTAEALPLIPTTTVAGPFRVEVKGQLYVRATNTRIEEGESKTRYSLSRARIKLDLSYLDILRIQIEPDFAGGDADPADVFADIAPHETASLRFGRAKVPFGDLELASRWRLPSLRRGLVSDLITERLGMGRRKVGVRGRVRLKGVPLKPKLYVGAYRDTPESDDDDAVARLEIRPFLKGSDLSLSGFARGGVAADGGHGFAGAVGFLYDRGGLFVALEGMVVRAALLSRRGFEEEDATLYAARLLLSYALFIGDFALEPFIGADGVDPNARTRRDLGGAIRGGLNLRYLDLGRLSVELDHQRGQEAFVEPDRTVITIFLGISLG